MADFISPEAIEEVIYELSQFNEVVEQNVNQMLQAANLCVATLGEDKVSLQAARSVAESCEEYKKAMEEVHILIQKLEGERQRALDIVTRMEHIRVR